MRRGCRRVARTGACCWRVPPRCRRPPPTDDARPGAGRRGGSKLSFATLARGRLIGRRAAFAGLRQEVLVGLVRPFVRSIERAERVHTFAAEHMVDPTAARE